MPYDTIGTPNAKSNSQDHPVKNSDKGFLLNECYKKNGKKLFVEEKLIGKEFQ